METKIISSVGPSLLQAGPMPAKLNNLLPGAPVFFFQTGADIYIL